MTSRINESNPDFLHPLQVALGPGVDQAKKQDANENKNLDKRKEPLSILHLLPEHRRHWKDKGNFHFEYDKDQRNEIKSYIKIHPGATACRLPALISRKFALLRIRRPQQFADQEVDTDESEAQNGETPDVCVVNSA